MKKTKLLVFDPSDGTCISFDVSNAIRYPKRSKAEPVAEPADNIFVAWSGRNPLYAVRAKSLMDALVWVRANHPYDAKISVKVDEGIYAARKLFLQADLKANAAGPAVESDRVWEVFDTRTNPVSKVGEVKAANVTRAVLAAEERWPLTFPPKSRFIHVIDKGALTANRLQPAEPDRDLADFRREFDAGGEAEAERLERRPAVRSRPGTGGGREGGGVVEIRVKLRSEQRHT